jgi:hypothetical protein
MRARSLPQFRCFRTAHDRSIAVAVTHDNELAIAERIQPSTTTSISNAT